MQSGWLRRPRTHDCEQKDMQSVSGVTQKSDDVFDTRREDALSLRKEEEEGAKSRKIGKERTGVEPGKKMSAWNAYGARTFHAAPVTKPLYIRVPMFLSRREGIESSMMLFELGTKDNSSIGPHHLKVVGRVGET